MVKVVAPPLVFLFRPGGFCLRVSVVLCVILSTSVNHDNHQMVEILLHIGILTT